jgi:hypothetical protein
VGEREPERAVVVILCCPEAIQADFDEAEGTNENERWMPRVGNFRNVRGAVRATSSLT